MNLNPWLSIAACKIIVKFSLHKIMTSEKIFSRDCYVKFKKDLLDYRDTGEDKAHSVPVQIISWDIFNMFRYLIDLPNSHRAVDLALHRTLDYCRRDFRAIFNDEDSKSILPVKQSYFATVQDFQISSVNCRNLYPFITIADNNKCVYCVYRIYWNYILTIVFR